MAHLPIISANKMRSFQLILNYSIRGGLVSKSPETQHWKISTKSFISYAPIPFETKQTAEQKLMLVIIKTSALAQGMNLNLWCEFLSSVATAKYRQIASGIKAWSGEKIASYSLVLDVQLIPAMSEHQLLK